MRAAAVRARVGASRRRAVGDGRRESVLPRPPPAWLRDGFLRFNHRLLRRRFAAVRIAGLERLPLDSSAPVLVFLNHPSWWDPLMCAAIVEARGRHRRNVALIDEAELSAVLARLGFVGIEPASSAGARRLVRLGAELARGADVTLWMTPQGRFADPRERPLRLAGGLARLANRLTGSLAVPLAIEYPFLGGRRPEARLLLGEPIDGASADEAAFETALESAMNRLAELVIGGEHDAFRTLVDATSRPARAGRRPPPRAGGQA